MKKAYSFESPSARELYTSYIKSKSCTLAIWLPENIYSALAPIIYAALDDDKMPVDTLRVLCSFLKTFAEGVQEHNAMQDIKIEYPPQK